MIAALYARVSTTDQNAETQLAALRRYCEARGWKIETEYVDTASGATAERPALSALMEPSSLRKVGTVVVWKFDRLFRSVQHMMVALDRFRTLGVDFVSVTECIDTTTPAGRFVYTLLAAVGEFEKDLIRERTLAGMERARAEGKRIGRPRVEIDQAAALKMWRGGKGMTIRQIAVKVGASPSKVWQSLQECVLKSVDTLLEQEKHVSRGNPT